MTLYKWSQTASSDATADSTINWAEGQAPSSINDSARAMMAATAKYRDDIAGAIVTSGTSTAYTVSSYEVFDTLAHLNGQMIAFTPHTTNGATVTLNVDSLGAKPLRSAPGVELQAGTIIQGTPCIATYNNTDGAFYLQGFFGNPYNIPLGASLEYWGSAAPNSSFAFPYGQAISRTTYATLYAIVGNTYGAGDGSTTFNLPDTRGRVTPSLDAMGGVAAGRLTATMTQVLGGSGGTEFQPLNSGEIPTITAAGGGSVSVNSTTSNIVSSNGLFGNNAGGAGGGIDFNPSPTVGGIASTGTATITAASNNTGGSAPTHPNVQPAIFCNRIMRII
jgi:microcystin-dependent protein